MSRSVICKIFTKTFEIMKCVWRELLNTCGIQVARSTAKNVIESSMNQTGVDYVMICVKLSLCLIN
jgi:hypothetical protein